VFSHQVGGDPEQPRPDLAAHRVERGALAERDHERFGGQVVGGRRAETSGYVPVDLLEVRVIDRGETLRIGPEIR
jgi:hypothetical protein